MPPSTAPISCSRETCFSALSWRRAPTKSRLTIASSSAHDAESRPVRKKDAGVTHVTERPFSCAEYTPGRVDGSNDGARPECGAALGSRCENQTPGPTPAAATLRADAVSSAAGRSPVSEPDLPHIAQLEV